MLLLDLPDFTLIEALVCLWKTKRLVCGPYMSDLPPCANYSSCSTSTNFLTFFVVKQRSEDHHWFFRQRVSQTTLHVSCERPAHPRHTISQASIASTPGTHQVWPLGLSLWHCLRYPQHLPSKMMPLSLIPALLCLALALVALAEGTAVIGVRRYDPPASPCLHIGHPGMLSPCPRPASTTKGRLSNQRMRITWVGHLYRSLWDPNLRRLARQVGLYPLSTAPEQTHVAYR